MHQNTLILMYRLLLTAYETIWCCTNLFIFMTIIIRSQINRQLTAKVPYLLLKVMRIMGVL